MVKSLLWSEMDASALPCLPPLPHGLRDDGDAPPPSAAVRHRPALVALPELYGGLKAQVTSGAAASSRFVPVATRPR